MRQNTYTICYFCTNCNRSMIHSIDKGTVAPETITCHHCGCRRAQKSVGWNKPDNHLPYKYQRNLTDLKYFEKGGKINAFG